MKQILQNLKDGSTEIAEVPCPQVGRGDLLIRTTRTLISAGTERMLVDFYEKELTFQVSCSYGPGRYDPRYEAQGLDYPIGFVRWTEQRNFEAVLDMLADGRLDVAPLVSHRFALAEAPRAYEVVAGAEPSLGIILEYPGGEAARLLERTVVLDEARGEAARVGAVGAGSARGGSGAGGGGEVPSLALGPGFPAGTTEEGRAVEPPRHSGREAGIQAREGKVPATSTPAVSQIYTQMYRLEVATMSGFAQRFLEKGLEVSMQQGVQLGEARILTAQLRLRYGELPAALSQRI